MKLGIISDTHDYFHPAIPKLFTGVDHIIHAGDVGKAWIILQLEEIAPVTAVLGNSDQFLTLKETEIIELAGRKILVRHIVNPRQLTESLSELITRERPDIVIFGHTHKRFNEVLNGTLYFNPGYAGGKSYESERSLAILDCGEKQIRPEFLKL
jgi:uncharacterized protein